MTFIPVKITSVGKAVPKTVVTNDDLAKILDTSDEWITSRTGIKERRIVSGNENSTTLGINAAKDALDKANMTGEDIDAIIVATSLPYHIYPSTGCAIQEAIGAKEGPAFDITAACTGMLYAMELGRAMINTDKYKNILIVATDANSRFVDWTDRSICVLFGDGAGALILSKAEDGVDDIIELNITSDGKQGKHLGMHINGTNCPLAEPNTNVDETIYMNGKEVYKFVMSTVPNSVTECLEKANMTPEDIDYLIPHQANVRIIEGVQSRLGYDDEKVIINIDKYGNTSAASILIALSEALEQGKVKTPSKAILCAFGAGLAWGSAIVRLRDGLK